MIIFKPETNEEILRKNSCTSLFYAYENGEKTGAAYMNIDGLFCDVFKVEYPKNHLYVCQGLLRSCYNAAANAGAYIGKLSAPDCKEAAESMNFIFDGSVYANDIPTLLMGSCGDCGV